MSDRHVFSSAESGASSAPVAHVHTPAEDRAPVAHDHDGAHDGEREHDGIYDDYARDIGEVPAVEVINTVAVHLLSAAAVKCGLGDEPDAVADLDEARKLIDALAGLVTASAPHIGDHHARALRDGLRSVQLAFREASPYADEIGKGPGEKWTGPVT